jgi:hypothetical protein
MRKASAIVLFCVYALLSVGVQMHLHYCCGKLADIHFFSNHGCSHHDEEHDDDCSHESDCCSFVDLSLKVDESHEQVASVVLDVEPIQAEPSKYPSCIPDLSSITVERYTSSTDPPDEKRYLLYRSLVLYA